MNFRELVGIENEEDEAMKMEIVDKVVSEKDIGKFSTLIELNFHG